MIQAFIGGGGGGGVIILIGLAFLCMLNLCLYVEAVILIGKKNLKRFAIVLMIALTISSYLGSIVYGHEKFVEAQKNRILDYDITVRVSPDGEFLVSVNDIPNSDEMILLSGTITFRIDFPDSRNFVGRCKDFQASKIDGEFATMHLGNIDTSWADRTALLSSFPPPAKAIHNGVETVSYRMTFRMQAKDYWSFSYSRTMRAGDAP